MIDLSIVIPFYNAEAYLNQMLVSICQSETQYEYEVILVDDGSTDSSAIIANKFVVEYRNILYFQANHGGVSRARNIGISKSSGTYICFIDADDVISPNYIECMVSSIRSGADLVVCGYELRNGKRTRQRKLSDADYYDLSEALFAMEIVKRTMVQSVWNKIFVKQIIDRYDISFPDDLPIAEDHSFFLDYCSYIGHIKTVSNVLYVHIKNDKSLSNNRFRYEILQQRSNTIYHKNMNILLISPSEQYKKLCSADYALDIYYALLQLVSEKHTFSYIKKELDNNKSSLICDHTFNRRHRLPLILKQCLKMDSTIILYLTLIILNMYYKIIKKRLNT